MALLQLNELLLSHFTRLHKTLYMPFCLHICTVFLFRHSRFFQSVFHFTHITMREICSPSSFITSIVINRLCFPTPVSGYTDLFFNSCPFYTSLFNSLLPLYKCKSALICCFYSESGFLFLLRNCGLLLFLWDSPQKLKRRAKALFTFDAPYKLAFTLNSQHFQIKSINSLPSVVSLIPHLLHYKFAIWEPLSRCFKPSFYL